MKKCNRYITSLLLTTIYMVIVFSPLAPLTMQSKHVAHAVTGECSGDCTVDGCSLERSAARTCCCWQKKNHGDAEAHLHVDDGSGIPHAVASVAPKKRAGCCDANKDMAPSATPPPASHTATPTAISSVPCGSGTLFAVLTVETTPHLPFFFTREIISPIQSNLTVTHPDRLTSRYADPPEPPPILS